MATQAGDDPADDGEVVSAADFSGLEELLDKGESTEADLIQWLEDNVEKYNVNVQAGAAYEAALAEGGDPDMTPAERDAIQQSPEFKEAADWWLGPGPEREPPIPNMAGIGRSGWDIMGVDEENCQPLLALDLTGGQVPNNEQNALLSDEAKRFMALLAHEFPDTCTPAFLAQLFRVRQQRVMAILALKKLEAEAEEEFKRDTVAAEAAARQRAAEQQQREQMEQQLVESPAAGAGMPQAAGATADAAGAQQPADASPADAHLASGQTAADGEAAADAATAADGGAAGGADGGSAAAAAADDADGEQPRRGRGASLTDFRTEEELDEFTKDMHELDVLSEVQDIVEHDLWECIHAEGTDERHIKLLPSIPRFKEGPEGQLVHDGLTAEQLQLLAEAEAREEDGHAVAEFSRRLAYNMGQLAPDVRKESRITAAPQRPGQGWTLVVQPLTRRKGKDAAPAYAAEPSGKARRLTESEAVTLERARPLRRRRQA